VQFDVSHGPSNAVVKVTLNPNESITAEAGTMIAMSGGVTITTTTRQRPGSGIFKAIKRVLSGESFFLNHFAAGNTPGSVWLAPVLPGDIRAIQLTGRGMVVQGGSYLACSPSVSIDLNFQGFKSLFAGEGLFWLKATGSGSLCLSSFGAIYPIEVKGEYIVDSGHIVAFDEGLEFSLTKAGTSWISSFLGGEGIVTRFRGQGTVWCQSHSPRGFGLALGPELRPRRA